MSLLLPGLYVPADSPVHRLDPRVKMGAALALMVLPFTAPGLGSSLLLATFVVGIGILSRVPLPALLRTVRTVFWLAFFMFFFYLFTTPGQTLIALGTVVVTKEGVLAGAMQVYRLCLLVVIAALLTYTTSSGQLAHGLEALLGPLERAGLPVRDLTLVLTIALRFVPVFFEEIETIGRAQRARGADPQTGGPLRRMRSLVPMFIPVLVSAFRRAEELAIALEARCFRCLPRRTRLYRLCLSRADLLASLIVLAVALAALALEGT